MRVRRLRKEAAHLEVTAFINLIVVLVPFLLSTAVFTRLAVLDLKLPAQAAVAQLQVNKLQLEVVLFPDAIEVGDRVGGLLQRIAHTAKGPDLAALNTLMLQIKRRYPQESAATVLAQPDTPYDTLVQVMDAMRVTTTAEGTRLVKTALFPTLSVGDAPRRAAAQ